MMHWGSGGMTAADLAAGLDAQRFPVDSAAVAERLLQQPDELHGLLRGLPALKVGVCHRRGRHNKAQRAFLGPVTREDCRSIRQCILRKVVSGSWTECTFHVECN